MFKRILIPVDGSDTCDSVFDAARDFHEKFGASIVLVHVDESTIIQNYVNYPTPSITLPIDGKARSEEILKRAQEALSIPEEHITSKILIGDPSSAILDAAKEHEADLILMCTHGMGAAKRFLLGSVTNRVVHHAEIPVLIIRQSKD